MFVKLCPFSIKLISVESFKRTCLLFQLSLLDVCLLFQLSLLDGCLLFQLSLLDGCLLFSMNFWQRCSVPTNQNAPFLFAIGLIKTIVKIIFTIIGNIKAYRNTELVRVPCFPVLYPFIYVYIQYTGFAEPDPFQSKSWIRLRLR